MAEIKIKGVSTKKLEDGTERVIQTTADAEFKRLTTYVNRLSLSKLKATSIKDKEGKLVNKPMYSVGTKEVTFNNNGKSITRSIKPNQTLEGLSYLKTHTYDYSKKRFIKLDKPLEIFTVNRSVETLLDLTFPKYLKDGNRSYTSRDGKVTTINKTAEFIIPMHYDSFIQQCAESIKSLVSNISKDFDKEHLTASMQLKESNKDIYIEQPQIAKNVARLYAILEEYPNVLPLLPSYIVNLPIIQEAFLKGKSNENVINMEDKLQFTKVYVNEQNLPIWEGLNQKVKSNSNSTDKMLQVMKNAEKELGTIDIKFENIKDEYNEAKKALQELSKLKDWTVSDTKDRESDVKPEDLDKIYQNDKEHHEESQYEKEAEVLSDEDYETLSDEGMTL